MRKKLTNTLVESFRGDGARLNPVLWDSDLKGFGCRYSVRSGTRTYIFQFRVRGRKNAQTITIGRHNDPYRVDQARDEALELKRSMRKGVDPVVERQATAAAAEKHTKVNAAQAATLPEIMEDYIANKKTKHGPLRPKSKASIRDTVERNLADWLDEPMATTVTRDACIARFDELSNNKSNGAQAPRARNSQQI